MSTTRTSAWIVAVLVAAACDASADEVAALKERVARLEAEAEAQRDADAAAAARPDPVAALAARLEGLERRLGEVEVGQSTATTNIDGLAERVAAVEGTLQTLSEASDTAQTEVPPPQTLIGVPECDDYITTYRACIDDKLPEAVKETTRKSLDTTIAAWKKAAATEAGRAGLASACEAATEAVTRTCASL